MEVRDAVLHLKADRAVVAIAVMIGIGGEKDAGEEDRRQHECRANSCHDSAVLRIWRDNPFQKVHHLFGQILRSRECYYIKTAKRLGQVMPSREIGCFVAGSLAFHRVIVIICFHNWSKHEG